MMENDGGPAFPRPAWDKNADHDFRQDGITVRDYFAAAALQGLIARPDTKSDALNAEFAQTAFAMADAMIAEREKRDA